MNPKQEHINWKFEYNLGIEDIDLQHHFFANLINRLSEEFKSSDNPEYQSALISELNAYARFHFISEENMMFLAGYPRLNEHRKHHLNLLEKLSDKENIFRLNPSQEDAEEVIHFLIDWFMNHTVQEDRLFADYLQDLTP